MNINMIQDGIKAYRSGVLMMEAIIKTYFPPDDCNVKLARNDLLKSLGRLKYVALEHEEREEY